MKAGFDMEFYNFVRLYYDPDTGRIIPKFICSRCGKEMDKLERAEIPCNRGGVAEYHRTVAWCNDCEFRARLKQSK